MSPGTLVLKTGHTPQISLSHTHHGLQHCSISMSFTTTAFLTTLSSCCFSVAKSCLTVCKMAAHQAPSPSLSPRVCSNSYPLSQWCYLLPSSPFAFIFSWHQGFFPMSWVFKSSSSQSIGASASAVVLPVYIQVWFPFLIALGMHKTQTGPISDLSPVECWNGPQIFQFFNFPWTCKPGTPYW